MAPRDTETCGRCSTTSAVAVTSEDGDAGDDPGPLGRAKRRPDEVATRPPYGR